MDGPIDSSDQPDLNKAVRLIKGVRRSGVGRTEVAAALSGGAVGVARCEVGEGSLAGEDLVAEVEEARGAGGGGDDAAVGVLPGGLAAGALVLDEDVRRTHRLPLRRRHGFSAASLSLWAGVGSAKRRSAPPVVSLALGTYQCKPTTLTNCANQTYYVEGLFSKILRRGGMVVLKT
jgi:hypothetical protein